MIEYTVKVDNDGGKSWYLNGKLHREDGPAVEWSNGDKLWYLNGEQHREDGPAVEYAAGDKFWFLNNKLHREDGPAIEFSSGAKFWYLNGQEYSEEDFLKKTQPVKEMSIAQIEKQLGYTIKVVK